MRRALCLHMPFLPSDRARLGGGLPPDSDAPLVLTRLSGSSLILDRCCPHARRLGLRPGMTLGQAQAIAPRLRAIERACGTGRGKSAQQAPLAEI